VPSEVIFQADLPKNSNAKILKRDIREELSSQRSFCVAQATSGIDTKR